MSTTQHLASQLGYGAGSSTPDPHPNPKVKSNAHDDKASAMTGLEIAIVCVLCLGASLICVTSFLNSMTGGGNIWEPKGPSFGNAILMFMLAALVAINANVRASRK